MDLETLRKTAKTCKLELSAEEEREFLQQFTQVLDYFKRVQDIKEDPESAVIETVKVERNESLRGDRVIKCKASQLENVNEKRKTVKGLKWLTK